MISSTETTRPAHVLAPLVAWLEGDAASQETVRPGNPYTEPELRIAWESGLIGRPLPGWADEPTVEFTPSGRHALAETSGPTVADLLVKFGRHVWPGGAHHLAEDGPRNGGRS